jgi:hypothetical protein
MVGEKGEYCSKLATNNGITAEQLYTCNPALGENGKNCGLQFQAGVQYCVGVSEYALCAVKQDPVNVFISQSACGTIQVSRKPFAFC